VPAEFRAEDFWTLGGRWGMGAVDLPHRPVEAHDGRNSGFGKSPTFVSKRHQILGHLPKNFETKGVPIAISEVLPFVRKRLTN